MRSVRAVRVGGAVMLIDLHELVVNTTETNEVHRDKLHCTLCAGRFM